MIRWNQIGSPVGVIDAPGPCPALKTTLRLHENPSVSRETTEPLLRSVGQRPTAYRERMATGGRRPKPDHVPTHQGSRRTPDQPSRHPENLPEKAMDCRSIGERKRSRSSRRRAEAKSFFTKASRSEAVLYKGERKRSRSLQRRAEARPFLTKTSRSDVVIRTATPGHDVSWRFRQNMEHHRTGTAIK